MGVVRVGEGCECRYDVFLSFRGENTHKTFTDHLYTALVNAGLCTFRDDEELERGEDIEVQLQRAIQQSRTSVIVFSKDYASSGWCLDELVMILERKRRTCPGQDHRHVVLPVFYDVDPSKLRKQTGCLAKPFARHQKNESLNKVNRWREALKEVADLAGMVLKNQADGLEIPIRETIYGGMTKAELSDAQKKEVQLARQDRTMEQTKDKKNALESYVYEMRNKLFNTYRSFTSDQEREGISRSLQQTEDWLYDDGDDETENAYTSKLEDLKKLVDPIESRYKDEEARAQATKDLLKCIGDYRMAVDSLSPMDREMIVSECFKVEQWLKEKNQQQNSMPKNMDPILWSSDIRSRTEELNSRFKHIFRSRASHREDYKGSNQHDTSNHK